MSTLAFSQDYFMILQAWLRKKNHIFRHQHAAIHISSEYVFLFILVVQINYKHATIVFLLVK
jgi:hypothetical protein